MGAGYNGHPRKCECAPCVKRRVNDYLARIHDNTRLVPETLGQTVPVRAHWRKCPRHLKKQPKFAKALGEQLRLLIRSNS